MSFPYFYSKRFLIDQNSKSIDEIEEELISCLQHYDFEINVDEGIYFNKPLSFVSNFDTGLSGELKFVDCQNGNFLILKIRNYFFFVGHLFFMISVFLMTNFNLFSLIFVSVFYFIFIGGQFLVSIIRIRRDVKEILKTI